MKLSLIFARPGFPPPHLGSGIPGVYVLVCFPNIIDIFLVRRVLLVSLGFCA